MARTRSFDESDVLAGAVHAFREHGYAGVSIKQLEQSTGLTSGSLYNAYEDKNGLFLAALAHYVDDFVAPRLAAHAGPGASLDDLRGYFLALLRPPLSDGFGCLVTNSAIEFGARPSSVSELVGKSLDLLEAGLRSVLAREIPRDAVDVAVMRLMLMAQGILVFLRCGRDMRAVEATIRAEFDHLKSMRR